MGKNTPETRCWRSRPRCPLGMLPCTAGFEEKGISGLCTTARLDRRIEMSMYLRAMGTGGGPLPPLDVVMMMGSAEFVIHVVYVVKGSSRLIMILRHL